MHNGYSDNSIYKVSPYVAAPSGSSNMHLLLFDQDNKRFLKTSYNVTVPQVLSTPDAAFDAKDVKKDLVFMDHTKAFNQQAIAILKDNAGYHLARMSFSGSNGAFSVIGIENVTSRLADIDKAVHFALDQQYGYLFYVAEGVLYQYDLDAKVLKVVRNLGDRKVSLLKFQRLYSRVIGTNGFNTALERMAPIGYSLILGTYDEANPSTSGKVEFLRVNGLMADLVESFPAFEGIGKPVDLTYLER